MHRTRVGKETTVESSDLVALAGVLTMATAHFVAPMLGFVSFIPRSWFLSAAGGVSVAYVFVHLLPDVAKAQEAIEETTGLFETVDRHAYVAALLGLVTFFGLERAAIASQEEADPGGRAGGTATAPGTFWVSVVAFAVYNTVLGYLVVGRSETVPNPELALFSVALALHFVVNDLGLRDRHQRRYDRYGRPLLIGAVVVGWAIGVAADLPEAAVRVAAAFLAGAIVLNVIKEELPRERQSTFIPLALGAAGYAALLLAV